MKRISDPIERSTVKLLVLILVILSQANASDIIHQCFIFAKKMYRAGIHYDYDEHKALQLANEAIQLYPHNPLSYACFVEVDIYHNEHTTRLDKEYVKIAKKYAVTKKEWAAIYRAEALLYVYTINPLTYNKAIYYYRKAFEIDKEIGNKEGEVLDLEDMGRVFRYQMYSEMNKNKAEAKKMIESQLACYQKALSVGVTDQYSKLYLDIGNLYKDNVQEALKFYKMALNSWKRYGGSFYTLSSIYGHLSSAYYEEGNTFKAKVYGDKADHLEHILYGYGSGR